MNMLHVMMMVNLTVPYPGDTDVGRVYNVEIDAAERFVSERACEQAALERNMNPRIVRNISRASVTRTIYACASLDADALSALEPTPEIEW